MEKTSNLNNTLLWFGAAVSIAEILTGALIAPLGIAKGIAALVLGHLIGAVILFLVGLIGAQTGLPAIESGRISFGKYGSYGFSLLNVLQLTGWTAVMIISGARVISQVLPATSLALWSCIIGGLIILWIAVGIQNVGKLNAFAVGGLFVLTVILSFVVFGRQPVGAVEGTMTFGSAVELGLVMPLSWLPVIGDYTRHAKKPVQGTLWSCIAYFVGSCWMYVIGLGAALYCGTSDLAQILMTAGLGIVGLIIVLLSTVTTTFLDAYSAGVSATNTSKRLNEKTAAVVVCIVGTLIAIFTPIEQYQDFLSFIGSVFAPMTAILITDYFLFQKRDPGSSIQWTNVVLWAIGFALYHIFSTLDTPLGSSLPVMLVICLLCVVVHYVKRGVSHAK